MEIMLGQYLPVDSVLHRLDPRTKIFSLFFLMIVIFAADGWYSYLFLSVATAAIIFVSRIDFITVLKSIKPLIWIIIFTIVIHYFTGSLNLGLFVSLRLVLIIVLSALLTFTTSPVKLTDAMEKILSPLKKFGVPAHELAMMMTIALRFIPTLLEETDKIIKAQKSRGVDFESGNIFKRLKMFVPVLVPLFLSSFRRADELAMAMEARCYRGGEGRTHFKVLKFTRLDIKAAVIVFFICLAGVLL